MDDGFPARKGIGLKAGRRKAEVAPKVERQRVLARLTAGSTTSMAVSGTRGL